MKLKFILTILSLTLLTTSEIVKSPKKRTKQKKSSKSLKKTNKTNRKLKTDPKYLPPLLPIVYPRAYYSWPFWRQNQYRARVNEQRRIELIKRRTHPAECNLLVEIFPMFYVQITRRVKFRLAFSSNCMKKKDINFEVDLEDNKYLNWNFHPTSVNLRLWDNVWKINYKSPRVIDRFDVMKSLEYVKADVLLNIRDKFNIDALNRNDTFLDPQKFHTFNYYTIAKLKKLTQFKCKVRENKFKGWKMLKEIADRMKDLELRKNGYDPKKVQNRKLVGEPEIDLEEDLKKKKKVAKKTKKQIAMEKKKKKEELRKMEEKEEKLRLEMGKKLAKLSKKKEFVKSYEIDCFIL